MTSYPSFAIRGMTYHLWLRGRWSIVLIAAALCIAAIIARIWPHEQWLVFAGVMSAAVVAVALAHLAGVFTFADRDLGAPESGFPRYMFVLPARSAALAAAPMLCGAAVYIATWAIVAKIVVDPMILWEQKITISALWPGFMLAAAITGLQATSWSPLWIPYVRVVASLAVLVGVAALAVAGVQFGASAWLLTGWFAALTAIFYPLAVVGIARARRGDGVLSSRRSFAIRDATFATRNRFASGLSAQVWLEVRRNILLVPCFGAGFPLVLATLSAFGPRHALPIPVGPYLIEPIAISLVLVLGAPIFAAGMHGLTMGKSDAWAKSTLIHPFIAIRPLTTAQLIVAKFRAAAVATLVTWGAVILIIVAWSFAPETLPSGQSMMKYAVAHVSWRTIGIVAILLAWMMLFTWKQMAQSMCITLYGRPWLATVAPIAGVLLTCALPAAGYFITTHERLRHIATLCAPWLIYVLVATKLGLGTWALSACRRRGLLSLTNIAIVVTAWAALVLLALLTMMWLLPWNFTSLAKLIGVAMLIPPGVRCLVALPALHANRHR